MVWAYDEVKRNKNSKSGYDKIPAKVVKNLDEDTKNSLFN